MERSPVVVPTSSWTSQCPTPIDTPLLASLGEESLWREELSLLLRGGGLVTMSLEESVGI